MTGTPLTFTMSGTGLFNLDAWMAQTFGLTERFKMEIHGDAFSITNTPQFSNPNRNPDDANDF